MLGYYGITAIWRVVVSYRKKAIGAETGVGTASQGFDLLLRAVEMETLGDTRIAGYYHSHPDGRARPSSWDVEQAIGGVTYLITGMAGGRIEHSAWRLEGHELAPEPLEVGEE